MINLTTLFSTLISSVINGTVTFLAIRYVSRIAEKAENQLKKEDDKSK
jgi:large-conductance mechanosensitive channel